MRKEKDEIIAELQFKIDHMESAYESVLHVSIHEHMIGGSNIIALKFMLSNDQISPPSVILKLLSCEVLHKRIPEAVNLKKISTHRMQKQRIFLANKAWW